MKKKLGKLNGYGYAIWINHSQMQREGESKLIQLGINYDTSRHNYAVSYFV